MDGRRNTIVYIDRNNYSWKRKWKKGWNAYGKSPVSGRRNAS